ncbi:hypothetical protein K493DRAFT_84712 [Basidiobolus meristosporus CBS 931.73]|uniref:Uncharacterized protein n=1 Tax=Basidiobolus meristosporus CBS 931.73 TaxID=1314790 RepID=A0A1Y1XIQ0_9FUNG|nr:hypothetical protein K493DRAFT_84712 [Basidiobolus meristosporus CBS 931.73]|eukprot:ORX85630.1 hypothetical protein K493DRAFT_84712 [Basidiobolus meristosporus CBS 931.73]
MFKSWKKKASSTKSDSSEKRFSLLGSKSSQSPLSGNSPEIPSAAYSQDGTGYQRKVSQTSTLLTTPSVASLNSQASSVVDLGATSTQPSEELKKCFSSPGPERNGQTPHKDANGLNVSVKKETGVRSEEEKRESAPVQPEAPPTAASTDLQTSENMAFIYQLDNRVQKLQSQVKDMRQYFKGLLKRDTEELVTASIKIQALARGHLVSQVIMFTSQV